MEFSIQYGTITKVEVKLESALAGALIAGTGTKDPTTTDNTTYVFEVADDSKVINIKNSSSTVARTISTIYVSYLEGEPPAPATPTINILSLQQPTTTQGKERDYGYKLDTENKVLTVTGQPKNYRMLEIKNYSKLSETLSDATGIAYTFSETADLPKAVADIKNSNDPKTGWVPANAALANDAAQIGISPALPTDDTWENCTGKIRFISYSTTMISEDELSLDIVLNRVAAPEIDIDKTNAIEGQEYNPFTGVLSYTNYPVIMLKTETEYGNKEYIVTKYIDHNGDEQTYDPNLNDPKDWRLELDNRTAGIPQYNGVTNEIKFWSFVQTYNMPVTGAASGTLVTTYADTNKDKPLTITLRSNSPYYTSKPTFAAPKITIDGKFEKLSGNVMGYINKPVITMKRGGVVGDEEDKTIGILLYQLSESFAQTPLDDKDIFTSNTEILNNWIGLGQTDKINLPDNFTGRVFFKELYQSEDGHWTGAYASTTIFRDFQKINTESISDLSIDNLKTNVAEGTVVTLDKDMYVTGVYSTNNATNGTNIPVVIYLQDADGNALQLNAECTEAEKADYESWSGKKFAAGSISGVLRGQSMGLPVLSLNTSTIDYTKLIGAPAEATDAPEITEVSTLDIADYGKLVLFSHFTYNGDDTFTDKEGNIFTAVDQLNSTPDWEQTVGDVKSIKADMAAGVEYRIKGYVGYSPEYGPVILPLAVVPSVRLLAPNPVNTEADGTETIKMNMISNNLTFTVDKTGFDPTITRLYYFDNIKVGNKEPEWTTRANQYTLSQSSFDYIKSDKITLKFKLVNRSANLESEIVTVEVTLHKIADSKCVDNIKDFKDMFINTENLPETGADNVADNTDNYYRLQEEQGGYARIREVSDKYLYIRTNLEDESQMSNQDLSDHSILLYNKHGWENTLVAGIEASIAPAAVAEGDTEEEEPTDLAAYTLKPGDIITNFALIPTRSGYGNLIADISDFTRTIRRVEGVEKGHNDPITVEAADFAGFTDADRMLRYRVEDVMVKKVPDSSEKGFYYYLDIPGKPVLNNGGVFEELTGWDVMQDDNAVFNLEGVVMLANGDIEEGQDGRYMFALVPPTDDNEDDYNIMPGGVAPGAPVITISGDFTDNENGTFLTTAKVAIKADAEGATDLTIYYTDDDSDPRTNSAAKKYTGPFIISKNTVIKAFATAKGAPNSEVSGAYFERTLTESKYVINFILGAQKDVPYHFTGNVRVAAKGGDYFFVRGTQGHYLPINVENNAIDLSTVNVGGYINDMVITPH
ncbi:MAG: chitobiase/beta-hexosaminidase C-terminal domain-containing protein, partial [Paramuribaculum sp.]|nr:chitobiase/beta-hexosaminidase C-terminal domain-containing protein [Paramuribaculum sp.]